MKKDILNLKVFFKRFFQKSIESQEVFKNCNIKFIGSSLPKISIGKGTYMNGVKIYCWDKHIEIAVGKYCSFADNITIIAGGEHDKDWVSTYPFIDRWKLIEYQDLKKPRFKGNIIIENDVWISNNVIILSGVTIHNGAVIGAGSLVTKDVPAYSIIGGNPAKNIGYRFDEDIINALENLKWWDWSEEKIRNNIKEFTNIQHFINLHTNGK